MPEVCRLLSVLGAPGIEAKDQFGRTPLHWSCDNGHVQVVKELLEHGADIEAKDNGHWTPLHWACLMEHLAVVNELLSPNDSDGATTSILGKRTSRGRAAVNTKDREGDTPLHDASWNGNVAVVKALLSGGVDCRVTNYEGRLPIHLVVEWPSIYFNISTQHSAVVSLFTNS